MSQDYSRRLDNLKHRRYDEALKGPLLSESFLKTDYPDSVKYAMESMVEIDPSYAYKVYAISKKIHEKLAKTLRKRGYQLDYRYQGELKTYSNILLYGDVELIVIKKEVVEKPHLDIQRLTMELLEILRGDAEFKSIDYSDKTRIRITAQKPTCEIDILPSVWVDSLEFKQTKNEIYRGIAEFDFKNKQIKKYLPFLNIARINARDQYTNGIFKCLSRLLKSLRADAEERIDLKDSEINAILYSIDPDQLKIDHKYVLAQLPKIKDLLDQIHTEASVCEGITSPSGKDMVFKGRLIKQKEIEKLNNALAQLIADITSDMEDRNLRIGSPIDYSTSLS